MVYPCHHKRKQIIQGGLEPHQSHLELKCHSNSGDLWVAMLQLAPEVTGQGWARMLGKEKCPPRVSIK